MIEKLKSFSFRKLLYNKKFTIPFSIFLSLVLWIFITIEQKPIIQRSFSDMTVNINMENTFAAENEMSIIGDISAQRFTVLVMGQNHIVTALTSDEINLFASAASVDSPGEYDLTVSVAESTGAADYDVISISPKTIKVSFDYIETRQFTVEALAEGVTASEGLIAEAAVVSGIEGNTISITGPRTVINSIETVRATTLVNKALSQSETFDATVVLLNKKNQEVSQENLQLSTNLIKITVPISQKKVVPVKVDFSNVPKNFDKSSINATVNHTEVAIIGTPETVGKIKEITLSPIDITTVTNTTQTFEVSAKLPEGVRMLDAIESFEVGVNLSAYRERVISVEEISYKGLSSNLSATAEVIKNVRICGPANIIQNLEESSVYAEIDLTDKKAGAHATNAVINFKGIDNVWAVGSYETSVTIK